MAVYSMTGYASATSGSAEPAEPGSEGEAAAAPKSSVGVELRSVNSRFLDLVLRLPDELRALEPALREIYAWAGRFERGEAGVPVSQASPAS